VDTGSTPQSALPIPQLIPSKIIARTGTDADSISVRGTSSLDSTLAFFELRNLLTNYLTVVPSVSVRGLRPACKASFCFK
jgi:hypothetical protein